MRRPRSNDLGCVCSPIPAVAGLYLADKVVAAVASHTKFRAPLIGGLGELVQLNAVSTPTSHLPWHPLHSGTLGLLAN